MSSTTLPETEKQACAVEAARISAIDEQLQTLCDTCWEPGHDYSECENSCNHCGTLTHRRKECPAKLLASSQDALDEQREHIIENQQRAVERMEQRAQAAAAQLASLRRLVKQKGSVSGSKKVLGAALQVFDDNVTWKQIVPERATMSSKAQQRKRRTLNAQAVGDLPLDHSSVLAEAMRRYGVPCWKIPVPKS